YGAWVAGNVADSWAGDPVMGRNTSQTLVSDPRSRTGVLRHIPNVIPQVFNTQGARKGRTIPKAETCRRSDGVCNTPDPFRDPIGALNGALGYANRDHGYRSSEVRQAPGKTMLPGRNHVPANIR